MGIISKYRYNKTTMRILLSFVILILLSFIQTTKATNAYVEEGLCNIVPIECDQSLQKNGVCCKGPNDDRLIYFPNSCLACMHVTIFQFRTVRVFI